MANTKTVLDQELEDYMAQGEAHKLFTIHLPIHEYAPYNLIIYFY